MRRRAAHPEATQKPPYAGKMLHLFVVRHGQTDFNIEGRYQGATDIALNATGIRQAKALAEQLQTYGIDVIVSSPLKRAVETARIIAETIGCDVHVMQQFAERGVGVYEGLTPGEAQRKYPELWAQGITRQINAAPPGGETILEVGFRILEGLDQLKDRFGNEKVLLVTHGFVARMIYGIVNRVLDERFYSYRLENGEIAEYRLI